MSGLNYSFYIQLLDILKLPDKYLKSINNSTKNTHFSGPVRDPFPNINNSPLTRHFPSDSSIGNILVLQCTYLTCLSLTFVNSTTF